MAHRLLCLGGVNTSHRLLKGSVVVVTLAGVAAAMFARTPASTPVRAEPPAALACDFEPGARGAFRLASLVHDARAPEQQDTFTALLSWQVDERTATSWRLRAALSQVRREQSLTLPEERVSGSLEAPFFIDVDASCRFAAFGFDAGWSARKRQLVQTLVTSWEFVLPADAHARTWRARQTDGLGPFEASYARLDGDGVRVSRTKAAYDGESAALALGLSLRVVGSYSTARFERGFLAGASGSERVRIEMGGALQADLVQRFSVVRDDAAFEAVPPAAQRADFSDAFALGVERAEPVDPSLAKEGLATAVADFLACFQHGDATHRAAQQLAAWLRANPDGARGLLAELRAQRIPEAARPALFLAFELSGTEASRDVLSTVLDDESFAELDRARAASALSDLGEPTLATAEQLRAHGAREGMVGNVGLLGLGNVGRRANDDALRTYVRDALEKEWSAASTDARRHLVLDAIGNSRDPALAGALGGALAADVASTRRHAAEALGRFDAGVAAPMLTARLRDEADSDAATAIVRALREAPPTDELVQLMTARLEASASVSERAALIAWLGAASRSSSSATAALVAQFQREPSARLQQLIGTFLPAVALR